ncbi:MAG: FHA domain-containing protein [Chloroflexota bacterium]
MSNPNIAQLIDPTGRAHPLTNEATVIGRVAENDIVITSKRVSREHAQVRRDGWRLILEDLGSTNGTFLNGQRLAESAQLRDGDQIKIGDVAFTFYDPDVTHQDSPLVEMEIDVAAGVVRVNRQPVTLSPKEFALLAYLDAHRGQVRSKDEIGTAVWPEYQEGVFDYQIENLIRRLRTKLEPEPAKPQRLLTVRGRGYKLVD